MFIRFSKLFFLFTSSAFIAGCTPSTSKNLSAPPILSTVNDPGFDFNNPGGYELPVGALVNSCPFISESFDMTPIINQIKVQLQTKIEGQEKCQAAQSALVSGLDSIQAIYSNLNSELGTERSAELYETFLVDLQSQIKKLNQSGQGSTAEAEQMKITALGIESVIRDLKSAAVKEKTDAENQRRNFSRIALINYLNQTVITATTMDAKCVNQLGGFQQLLPSLLGAASIATGVSVFSGQIVAAGAFQLASNIARLFQNQDAKKALRSLVQLQNEKVLACTYYAIQNKSCEIKRAQAFANANKQEIINITSKIPVRGINPEWDEYFRILQRTDVFENIFNDIAVQGSSISLDLGTVFRYFSSLQINPEAFPPAPGDEFPDQQQSWLNRVRNAGLNVPTANQDIPLTIQEQVKFAVTSIKNAIQFINLIESQLRETKSFDALKDRLVADHPNLEKDIREAKSFLESQALKLPPSKRGGIFLSVLAMNRLQEFLDVGAESVADLEASEDGYIDRLTTAGVNLFKIIAMGSVAQLSRQEILALGSKANDRLVNSFKVIERRFVEEDVNSGKPFDQTFVAFKQNQLLFYRLAEIYNDLRGPSTVFLSDDQRQSFEAFELGFESDIISMLEQRLKIPTATWEEAQGPAQLCSLFSGFLMKSKKAKKLYETCQKNYKVLRIDTLTYTSNEVINHRDPCFYNEFVRKTNSFKVLDWVKTQQ